MNYRFTFLLMLIMIASGIYARKVAVTSTTDNVTTPTAGMLRYCIKNALKNDTIVFNVSIVTLAGEISFSDKSIVIDGGSSANVTIDANQTGRIFNISSYSASNKLVIKNLTLKNGKISGSMGMGGAMYLFYTSGEVNIENCVFENNNVVATGDGQGGAVRTNGGVFTNCSFINNHVTGTTSVLGGGAVFGYGGTFVNCVVAGNSAKYGGGLMVANNAIVSNCTITDNRCTVETNGAGVCNEGAVLTNCIVWGNTSNNTTDNIKHYSGSYKNCAFETGNSLAGSNGNIALAASPFISALAPYDLQLNANSTCIDAGTVTGITITEFDIAGKDRVSGSSIDMGAHERYIVPNELPKYAALPFTESFEAQWVNFLDIRDVPSDYWKNTPATGNSSWSREDDGVTRGAWSTSNNFGYTPTGANGSGHSAAFNSYWAESKGNLDLHVDYSTLAGNKALYFYYRNNSGNDKLEVYVSDNGGITFSPVLATFGNTTGWVRKAVDLGNLTSKKGVVRITGNNTGSCCTDRIGIDDVLVGSHTTTPVVANFTANNTSGYAPLNVLFSDLSTGDVTSWKWDFNNDGTIDATLPNPSYTFTTAGTYTVKLEASKPGKTDTKTITIEVAAQPYASLPFYEGFENTWVNREATRDVPALVFKTSPALGQNTWRRDDDGASISYPSYSNSTDYSPRGAKGTARSARFFNLYNSYTSADLDLYVDFSTQTGDKTLSFWYINSGGTDKLTVSLSTDGGLTFGSPLVTKTIDDLWTKVICSLGNVTATQGVIRFRASFSGGLHVGIDEIRINNPQTVDIDAHFTSNVKVGKAPLVVNFSDASGGAPTKWSWDFNGDGVEDSNVKNPTYTFSQPGLHTVTLKASKDGSSGTATLTNYVFVAGKASLPFHESFDNTWVMCNGNRDVPNIHWANSVARGNNSWSRNEDGLERGAWTTDYGYYTPSGALGTPYSAGFNSRDSRNLTGSFDLWADFSTLTGKKRLEFWYINKSGDDFLTVKISTDGGATFGNALRTLQQSIVWQKIVVELGEINASSVVVRFLANGGADGGWSNIGIDEVKIFNPTALPLNVAFDTDLSSGAAPLQVKFTDVSEGDIQSWAWDFNNDGTIDATSPSATHTFTNPGCYSVSLKLTDKNSSKTLTKTNLIVVPGYASLPFVESFEQAWVSRDGIRDVPSFYAKNTPASHPETWSRDDDGVARGVWDSNNGAYSPTGTNGTAHSARIKGGFSLRTLDFYIDFSTQAGEKELSFWSITPNSDKLDVYLSEDGGATFGNSLVTKGSQYSWAETKIKLGDINSPTTVVRFAMKTPGNSGYAGADNGIDEIKINAIKTIKADFQANVVSGPAPLTVKFTDLSTAGTTGWEWDFNNDNVVDATTQSPSYTFVQPGSYTVSLQATQGFSVNKEVKTAYIQVNVSSGINTTSTDDIKLYPNPTTGKVFVSSKNNALVIHEIVIVDLAGKVIDVVDSHSLNQLSFNLTHLPKGTVFVKLICNSGVVVQKLILK
jgi:PKD repeat protein